MVTTEELISSTRIEYITGACESAAPNERRNHAASYQIAGACAQARKKPAFTTLAGVVKAGACTDLCR